MKTPRAHARNMKVLKKARDNDNSALINPAKSSGGREIIPKFSNYDVRAHGRRGDTLVVTAAAKPTARNTHATRPLVRYCAPPAAGASEAGPNAIRAHRKGEMLPYVLSASHNTEFYILGRRRQVRGPFSQSLNPISFTEPPFRKERLCSVF